MPSKQSDATALREAKAILARVERNFKDCETQRVAFVARTVRLEKELAVLNVRFYKLLERTEKVKA